MAVANERERAEAAESVVARLLAACDELDAEAERTMTRPEGMLGTSLIRHLIAGGTLDTYDELGSHEGQS
ncbi:hypothetical protein [Luteipulveratus halotolerans]|nr:hypothetical protein [Luteipulveratus halotolerans]